MCKTQCVPFDGCKLTIPMSLENGPSLRYTATLSDPIEERAL